MEIAVGRRVAVSTLADPKILGPALIDAFRKLDPRVMIRNPVMFTVEIVASLTTILFVRDLVMGVAGGGAGLGFSFQINLWLWFTVLFANFAEAVAEGRGKAQAATLRKAKTDTVAKRCATCRLAPGRACRRRSCARATSCWSRRAISFHPMAK